MTDAELLAHATRFEFGDNWQVLQIGANRWRIRMYPAEKTPVDLRYRDFTRDEAIAEVQRRMVAT